MQTVELDQYSAKLVSEENKKYLEFGTWGSHGLESIKVVKGEGWQDRTVTATFTTKNGSTKILVPFEGIISIPKEANELPISRSNPGIIVFSGVGDDGSLLVSSNVPFIVIDHGPFEGDDPDPTPDIYEQFVQEIKMDADRAEQAAEDAKRISEEIDLDQEAINDALQKSEENAQKAETAAAEAEKTKESITTATTESLKQIESSKNTAVGAVNGARDSALSSIEGKVNTSLESLDSLVKEGTASLEKTISDGASFLETAANEANSSISTAKEGALSAIETSKTSAVTEISENKEAALSELDTFKSSTLNEFTTSSTEKLNAINTAGDAQTKNVNDAGAVQVKAVQDEGAEQVLLVTGEGDEQVKRIEALVPDVYTKDESDARYAPIEAAIKVSGKGDDIVSLSPTIPWHPPELSVFGKSRQFTTTGAQLIPFKVGEKIDSFTLYTSIVPTDSFFTINRNRKLDNANDDIYFLGDADAGKESSYKEYDNLSEGLYYAYCSSSSVTLFVVTWRDGKSTIIANSISGQNAPFTVQSGDKFRIFFRIKIFENTPDEENVYAIIRKAENGPNYEPYTGGIASPNPEYPQEIANTGDDGQVDITVCGKNLLNTSELINNMQYAPPNGALSPVVGRVSTPKIQNPGVPIYVYATAGCDIILVQYDNEETLISRTFPNKNTKIVLDAKCVKFAFTVYTSQNEGIVDFDTLKSDFVIGPDLVKQYYSYVTPQQLPVPTPDGLPGIPVNSGGNYTDANGQQLVSDMVDLAAGTKTQNCAIYKPQESSLYLTNGGVPESGKTVQVRKNMGLSLNPHTNAVICNFLSKKNPAIWTEDEECYNYAKDGYLDFRILKSRLPSVDEAGVQAFCANIGAEFLYALYEPITTPLTDEELAAFRALQTYSGTTNIIAQDCGIEASALANPNEYIDQKISAAVTEAVSSSIHLLQGG